MKIILNSTQKGKVFSKKRTWQLWEQNSSSEQMAGARGGGVGAGQVREDLTSKNKTVVVSPDQTCSTISTLKVTSLADKACMKPTCCVCLLPTWLGPTGMANCSLDPVGRGWEFTNPTEGIRHISTPLLFPPGVKEILQIIVAWECNSRKL